MKRGGAKGQCSVISDQYTVINGSKKTEPEKRGWGETERSKVYESKKMTNEEIWNRFAP